VAVAAGGKNFTAEAWIFQDHEAQNRHGNRPDYQGRDAKQAARPEDRVEGLVRDSDRVGVGHAHVQAANELHHAQRDKEGRNSDHRDKEPVQGPHDQPKDSPLPRRKDGAQVTTFG
jgi:hypothetical protein